MFGVPVSDLPALNMTLIQLALKKGFGLPAPSTCVVTPQLCLGRTLTWGVVLRGPPNPSVQS